MDTEINFTVPMEGHIITDNEKVNNKFCCEALTDWNTGTLGVCSFGTDLCTEPKIVLDYFETQP